MGLTVILDAEFDSLTPTKLWCVVTKELETGEERVFRYDQDKDWANLTEHLEETLRIVGHNASTFDVTALLLLVPSLGDILGRLDVVDTLVLSRLINYKRRGGHSLENIGKLYGLEKKPIIEYDNPDLIDEYVERCISDVRINHAFYRKELERFVNDPDWAWPIKLEHELAVICKEMHDNGFHFNYDAATTLLDDITTRLDTLTEGIQESVGPIEEVEKTVTLRRKKDGSPDVRTASYLNRFPDGDNDWSTGDTREIRRYRQVNPGSPKDRLKILREAGWNPTEKTKTHREAERVYRRKGFKNLTEAERARWERLQLNGWVVNETNLKTLPEDAPTGARKLAEWLTLEGRRADLEEWLGHYRPSTGRIHSDIIHIGSWTHRSAHRNPNCANIFSAFHGTPTGPVEEIKAKYDHYLRALWDTDAILVGTDAEGIQLRVLAHLMGDEDYINAVANGRKEDKTDVHNVNLRALALDHLVRDHAKTFIYAWLLGAGIPKVGSILQTTTARARGAVTTFLERTPALKELKETRIPLEAQRGFFEGLDGRKVVCDSEHLMLAGHLQNGEKVIMGRANLLWRERLRELGVDYRQVNFVHDEWVTETFTMEEAKIVKKAQEESIEQAGVDLNLLCPLKGEGKIGSNWLEIH